MTDLFLGESKTASHRAAGSLIYPIGPRGTWHTWLHSCSATLAPNEGGRTATKEDFGAKEEGRPATKEAFGAKPKRQASYEGTRASNDGGRRPATKEDFGAKPQLQVSYARARDSSERGFWRETERGRPATKEDFGAKPQLQVSYARARDSSERGFRRETGRGFWRETERGRPATKEAFGAKPQLQASYARARDSSERGFRRETERGFWRETERGFWRETERGRSALCDTTAIQGEPHISSHHIAAYCLYSVFCRDRFELMMLAGSILLTFLGCLWPFVNSFVLMTFGIPCAALLRSEMSRCRDALACFVARKSIVLWLAAVFVWLSDRFACGAWRHLSLPGGHWLWHLLVALSSYQAIVFIVYAGAVKAVAGQGRPVMRLWPADDWRLTGVAYVELKTPLPQNVETNGNLNHIRSKNC